MYLGLSPRERADLEVAADDEEVNALPLVDLAGLLDGRVDSVESAMALALRQLRYTHYETRVLRNPRLRCAS